MAFEERKEKENNEIFLQRGEKKEASGKPFNRLNDNKIRISVGHW